MRAAAPRSAVAGGERPRLRALGPCPPHPSDGAGGGPTWRGPHLVRGASGTGSVGGPLSIPWGLPSTPISWGIPLALSAASALDPALAGSPQVFHVARALASQ